jgi:hypothetical protein
VSDIDQAKTDIQTEMASAVNGFLPTAEERQFFEELALELASEKVRYALAMTDEDKTRTAENIAMIGQRFKLRLARKELAADKSAEKILSIALTAAVKQFFPGVAAIGSIVQIVANGES